MSYTCLNCDQKIILGNDLEGRFQHFLDPLANENFQKDVKENDNVVKEFLKERNTLIQYLKEDTTLIDKNKMEKYVK